MVCVSSNWPKFSRLALLLSLSMANLCGDSLPADDAPIRDIVDAAIRPLLADHDIPGIAVGLTVDEASYFFGYGVASNESGSPVDETTIFEIGSVSKTFTTTLASYAHELGRLSFDDHPSRYLPVLEGTPIDRANLLQLGTYTAGGLPLQFPADEVAEHGVIRNFQQWRPDSAPGEQRRYSNPSIGLLGHITALALGTDFVDAVEIQLLPALGLSDTYIRVPERAAARYAWGYDSENRPVRVTPGLFDAEAYGIKSTAADMLRFVQINIDPTGIENPMRRAIGHAPKKWTGDWGGLLLVG